MAQPPNAHGHERGHGEYKTPGGKMVVADVSVEQDQLRQVVISGDFFLYPEETLTLITTALDGQPADASREALTAAVDAAVPPDAELFGFSAEAVAIAVRRALGHDLRAEPTPDAEAASSSPSSTGTDPEAGSNA